jgi:hypothetical protein
MMMIQSKEGIHLNDIKLAVNGKELNDVTKTLQKTIKNGIVDLFV